jgi:hypothetical protein
MKKILLTLIFIGSIFTVAEVLREDIKNKEAFLLRSCHLKFQPIGQAYAMGKLHEQMYADLLEEVLAKLNDCQNFKFSHQIGIHVINQYARIFKTNNGLTDRMTALLLQDKETILVGHKSGSDLVEYLMRNETRQVRELVRSLEHKLLDRCHIKFTRDTFFNSALGRNSYYKFLIDVERELSHCSNNHKLVRVKVRKQYSKYLERTREYLGQELDQIGNEMFIVGHRSASEFSYFFLRRF